MVSRSLMTAMVFGICVSTALASPVQVSVENGFLMLRGDDEANRVHVFGAAGDSFEVYPEGGLDEGFITVEGVTKGVIVDLNGGNDVVRLEDTHVPMITIRTGTGTDGVSLNDVGKGTDLIQIETGDGDDFVRFDILELTGNMRINLGRGNDRFRPFGSMEGSLILDGGSGDDFFEPEDLEFFGVHRDLTVQMGAGNDAVITRQLFVLGRTKFDGGPGSDALDLSEGSFARRPTVLNFETVVR